MLGGTLERRVIARARAPPSDFVLQIELALSGLARGDPCLGGEKGLVFILVEATT